MKTKAGMYRHIPPNEYGDLSIRLIDGVKVLSVTTDTIMGNYRIYHKAGERLDGIIRHYLSKDMLTNDFFAHSPT